MPQQQSIDLRVSPERTREEIIQKFIEAAFHCVDKLKELMIVESFLHSQVGVESRSNTPEMHESKRQRISKGPYAHAFLSDAIASIITKASEVGQGLTSHEIQERMHAGGFHFASEDNRIQTQAILATISRLRKSGIIHDEGPESMVGMKKGSPWKRYFAGPGNAQAKPSKSNGTSEPSSFEYRDMSQPDAIRAILKKTPGLTTNEVTGILAKGGYPFASKAPSSSLCVAIGKMKKDGEIRQERQDMRTPAKYFLK